MNVTLLAGGVGGARLAHGLDLALGATSGGTPGLTVVVNVGDDVELHGLAISPDIDTVLYTLAGLNDEDRGWGLRGESYATLAALKDLGEDTWFTLGDRDLATHIVRTARLRRGEPLSAVTAHLARAAGVRPRVLPVTDDRLATLVDTPSGRLGFQEYFVGRQHADAVLGLHFDGADAARPAPGVLDALAADLVVLAPSNPFLSIEPLLAVPGVRAALAGARGRRVAVSPIVGGQAIKGPAAQILESLGHEVSALGVARIYADLVDVMVIDERDAALAGPVADLGLTVRVTDTIMGGPPGRERLARELLALA
ncbi:2-phospho-L-lactate transferase [Promicromonospora thailandica]|uniref:LPPG:FO 2-phospho-L-lactate transferase n=1 Tax=Promicromonospora thailandica TaxID=765201 RepID=A0A9X2JWB6_9MICO|nr:2-phospho-L-lactate transferase [Promicromonospora thailandica]MCP2266445.1 LPPG:FO 2-phospho-L-lactate transferase [Promicromonospora thailandica]BFF20129.1 2-phospho-L-lactate transferase [Promicromonospora thailandica]